MVIRSMRLRLTLWYFAVLAVIIVALSLGAYFTLRTNLSDNLNESLQARAGLMLGVIDYDNNSKPTLADAVSASDQSFARVVDPFGRVLYEHAASFGNVPVDQSTVSSAVNGRSPIENFRSRQLRMISVPIRQNGQVIGVLQVGESTDDLDSVLNDLALVLGGGAALALVAASAGGWWLSSRALRPIAAITDAARDISEHDLSRRLRLDLPDDEVGQLARTFDEMIARLEAAFERQRQFTADASHELRTPVAVIKGQVEVALQRPRSPDAYQETLRAVNEQVDRMTRLIRGLLLLARADAGALPVRRELVDPPELLQSLSEQLAPVARAKGLSLVVECEGAVPVDGDEDLLLNLMLNLADNALKYTESGGVTLGCRSEDDRVHLFVRDTGPGIPDHEQERIFERFYRVDTARGSAAGGFGLGLAIARWIVEAHGGHLALETSASGSTFTAILPTARLPDSAEDSSSFHRQFIMPA